MSSFERRGELGRELRHAIDLARNDIIDVCREIFDRPEPAFREEHAAQLLEDLLTSHGFDVTTGLSGYSTAFHGLTNNWDEEAMRKGLQHGHVAFLAEYDAPPGQGHVAGKHLAAGGAVAASIGLAATLSGLFGTVSVFGCPGSEAAGGKIKLTEDGYFDPVDAALGVFPRSAGEGFQSTVNFTGETMATASVIVSYENDAEESLARLQEAVRDLLSDLEAPTSIDYPDNGFQVTALRAGEVTSIVEQITALAETRAASSGTPVMVEIGTICNDTNVVRVLARRTKTYGDNFDSFRQDNIIKSEPGTPVDWGNVSYVTPTNRTSFSVSTEPIPLYDPAFAALSNTSEAYDQMFAAAKATALTGLDLIGDMEFRGFSEGEFIRGLQARGINRTPRRWTGVHPVYPRKPGEGPQIKLPEPGAILRGPGLPPDTDSNG